MEYTKTAVSGVGWALGSGASSVYNYLRSFVGPNSERTLGTLGDSTIGFSAKDISKVIENYQMIQARFKANDLLLKLETEYYEQLKNTISGIGEMNSSDTYIKEWIDYLTKRQLEVQDKISLLEQNQELYQHYKNDVPSDMLKLKGIVSDDDEFWLCSICEENRKDRALDCGHVYCDLCLNRMRRCPLCKMEIDRNKIRPVFL